MIHKLSHLPIVVDPSHGTDLRDRVAPMARAAVAAGAEGLLIEAHPDPDRARNDGAQSLFPAQFERLMTELRIIAPALGPRSSDPAPAMRRSAPPLSGRRGRSRRAQILPQAMHRSARIWITGLRSRAISRYCGYFRRSSRTAFRWVSPRMSTLARPWMTTWASRDQSSSS